MLVFVLFIVSLVACRDPPSLISYLPGYEKGEKKLPFTMYGGYLPVPPNRNYYYTFVESFGSQSDPVVLWLNGGPGCSSLQGFSIEVGPLNLQPDGETFHLNPNTWAQSASMIFLEAPCGVGFSYFTPGTTNDDIVWNDDLVATDILSFLVLFFQTYPQFSKNELYIVGESYGGYYVPVLAKHIFKSGGSGLNFKGWMIGNGLMDDEADYNSIPLYLFEHSLVTLEDYSNMMKICFNDPYVNRNLTECVKAYDSLPMSVMNAGINPYFLYDMCLPSSGPFSFSLSQLQSPTFQVGIECADIFKVMTYMNRTDVKHALHSNPNVDWTICDFHMKYDRIYTSMVPFYQELMPHYRALFYSGDCDSIVNSVGSKLGVEKIGMSVSESWKVWKNGKLPGGFVEKFGGDQLTFVTVRGAGHMAPMQHPVGTLQLFQTFLNGTCC